MKLTFITTLILLCSFSPVKDGYKEITVCEALKQITAAMKTAKYSGLVEGTGEDGYFACKIDIAKWDDEQVFYDKATEFSFTATYNASGTSDAKSAYAELKKTVAKCLKLEPLVMEMSDGETVLFEISETTRIEIDLFAGNSGGDSWIDMKVTRDL